MVHATYSDAAANPSGFPCERSEATLATSKLQADGPPDDSSAAGKDRATAAQSRRLTPAELSIALLELERAARLLLFKHRDSPAFRMQYSQWAKKLMDVVPDGKGERVAQAIADILLMLDVDPDSAVKVVTRI